MSTVSTGTNGNNILQLPVLFAQEKALKAELESFRQSMHIHMDKLAMPCVFTYDIRRVGEKLVPTLCWADQFSQVRFQVFTDATAAIVLCTDEETEFVFQALDCEITRLHLMSDDVPPKVKAFVTAIYTALQIIN